VSREALFAAFFFAVFLFLLYQLYLFLAAFFAPLVWAAILALTFYPLTARLVGAFRGRRSLAAFTLVLAVTVLAILPSFFLGSLLVHQATDAYGRVQHAVQEGDAAPLVDQIRASRLGGLWTRVEPLAAQLSIDVSDLVLRATDWVSDQIVEQATNLARNVLDELIDEFRSPFELAGPTYFFVSYLVVAAVSAASFWAARTASRIASVPRLATPASADDRGPRPESTASAPSTASRSAAPSAGTSAVVRSAVTARTGAASLLGSRTTAVTSWPSATACSSRCRPMPPVAATMVSFMEPPRRHRNLREQYHMRYVLSRR